MTLPSGGPAVSTAPEFHNRNHLRASLLIGLCCFVIYNANFRSIAAGDTYPARYLPFAIWHHQTLRLDPIATITAQGRAGTAFWMVPLPDGHVISLYPVTAPLLVAPLYAPAVAYLHVRGWDDARVDRVARIMEKVSASFVTALSAALLYLLLRRRATTPIALLLTIAYAFGTTTWVISSQALWQHGMAELLIIAALLLLTGPFTAKRAIALGLLFGLIVANRPPDAILVAALGICALFWTGWRRAFLLIAGAALPIALLLLYNFGVAGNIGGGYGLKSSPEFFHHELLTGIAGLLFSPGRGLFVFSPFLLFLVLAWRHLPRLRSDRWLAVAMTIAIVLQILLYAKTDWRGGMSFGPRYLTDLLPFLIWMLVPIVMALSRFGRALFVVTVGIAIVIQAIGAFWYTGKSDIPLYDAALKNDTWVRIAWDWGHAPYIASFQDGLAPREMMLKFPGSFDAFEIDHNPVTTVTAGQQVVAVGWALAGHETPWQVSVMIDGGHTYSTREFIDRPDVRNALQVQNPAGWRIAFDTSDLAPGVHRINALVWASEKGEGHFLQERTLTVVAPDVRAALMKSSNDAAARVREHQQSDGSWLTAFTSTTQFRDARPEMNTFLTSILTEILEPIAAKSDLEPSLQRARQHLTKQIEPGGLVRYHGLPNGPGIGTLGCAITPDTDDTALAWRIAPHKDRRELATALATIDQYRTSDGLYRTWLAPRDKFQCLDPGRDPNPADLVIQMHLLLLLAEERPQAGRALCEALRPVVDDDRVWNYYKKTPLVPILRLPDLRRAGCALTLPESRTRTTIPEQQIWVSVGELLTGRAPRDAAKIESILRELASDDFASLRKNPPLLYHNDLTASVSRYYWSEDVGYALWLRLHDIYEHLGDPNLQR